MNIKNIKFAIRALEEVPKDGAFDMGRWGEHRGAHSPEEKNYCGTTACAGGWIALHPDAPSHGLTSSWENGDLSFWYEDGSRWNEFNELAKFLGVDCHLTRTIFSAGSTTVPVGDDARRQVIQKLRKLLNEEGE